MPVEMDFDNNKFCKLLALFVLPLIYRVIRRTRIYNESLSPKAPKLGQLMPISNLKFLFMWSNLRLSANINRQAFRKTSEKFGSKSWSSNLRVDSFFSIKLSWMLSELIWKHEKLFRKFSVINLMNDVHALQTEAECEHECRDFSIKCFVHGAELKNASCSYWKGLWWHAALFAFLLRLSPGGDIEFIRLKTIREHERTRSHLHIRRRSQVRLIGVDIAQELVLKRFSNRFSPEKINRFKMSSAIRKLMFVLPKSRTEITPSGLSSCADGFGIYCLTDLITWITAIITPN